MVRALGAIVLLGSWLFPDPSHANDATFGGAGGSLTVRDETRVQMRSEDILMTFDDYRWNVEAEYVFFNHASETVTLQVGFPELRCEQHADCVDVAFKNLTTHVDGKVVSHRRGKLADDQAWSGYLGLVWLFDVTFPAEREVRVRHSYSVASGEDVEGFTYTSYVTKTGARWKGTIESARFRGRFPPFTHTIERRSSKGLTESPPVQGASYVEYTLEGKNWVPREDVEISFNVSPRMARRGDGKDTAGMSCFYGGRDEPSAQECLNLLYAARGYNFESAALREYFYSGNPQFRQAKQLGFRQVWVRDMLPLEGFSERWFTQRDKPLLVELRKKRAAEAANPTDTNQVQTPSAGGTSTAPAPSGAVSTETSSTEGSTVPPATEPTTSASTQAAAPSEESPPALTSPTKTPSPARATPTPDSAEAKPRASAGLCAWSVAGLEHAAPTRWLLTLVMLVSCRWRNTRAVRWDGIAALLRNLLR